jgi:hypothetical protein
MQCQGNYRVDSSEMRVKGLFVASSEMRACGAPTRSVSDGLGRPK